MNRDREKQPFPWWAHSLILIAIEGLISLLLMNSGDVFSGELSSLDLSKALCDAFFVPGILVISVAALMFVSGEGALDGLKWGLSNVVKALIPGGRFGTPEKYGDYVMRKRGERKKGNLGAMFLAGGVFVLASVICLMVYMSIA